MTASGASQTLRPILPAPSLQPIAGPSRPAPQAVLRPPGTFRPILPAPARPLEVGQIPYPGLPAQAPAPPPIASRAIAPAPGSLQMIDPALWSSGTPPPVSDATTAPQTEAGAPSSSESGDPTPLGGQPQQSRPRPRPLRKRVAEVSSEPADAPPPRDDHVNDAEAATPAATGKDKGKAKAIAPPQGDDEHEEETHPQARKPTKRSRNVAADRPPSKKRTTKKKTTLSAGDQVVSLPRTSPQRQEAMCLICRIVHRILRMPQTKQMARLQATQARLITPRRCLPSTRTQALSILPCCLAHSRMEGLLL